MSNINEPLATVDEMEDKYLSFGIADDTFAVDLKYVTEIVGIQPITKVPEIPDYIKGIINLRGKVVPVIDLRLRFKKEEIPYTDRTCIIIVEFDDICIGYIVDNVKEVLSIGKDNINPPPDYKTGAHNRYLSGVGIFDDNIILILDCMKILTEDELSDIKEIKDAEKENTKG